MAGVAAVAAPPSVPSPVELEQEAHHYEPAPALELASVQGDPL
ncbi:hypothetical protein AA106555_1174 [Neokomagataea thailandica NBRC 106555]|uniref:Uncharacterized protein n=1 Tax=Neokomagataea thailandica NBRC 106555 TaxID=1223520 RepID=A0ABQ0QQ74_9PROT|nr:hypothetical protein AA106555_1174 [Neokomagataea thailandica NBRC 106555]